MNIPTDQLTSEKCLEAVKNGLALEHVPEHLRTPEMLHEAVKRCGFPLEYIPLTLRDREICIEALRKDDIVPTNASAKQ